MLLIASQLCRRLPLSKRCLVDLKGEEWEFDSVIAGYVQFYLDDVSNVLSNWMIHCPKSPEDIPSEAFKEILKISAISLAQEVSDLMDYRLLRTVIVLTSQAAERDTDW